MLGRGRGGPSREGAKVLGREPMGDVILGMDEPGGAASPLGPGNLETRAGDAGRPICDNAGEAGLNVLAGDVGRAMRDIADAAGLVGL